MIGEENQPLGVFIQTADREDTLAVVDEIDNVVALAVFCGAHNADRLIQRNQHQIIRFARLNQPSVNFDQVARLHLIANRGALAIDKDVALFNKAVRFATRADAAFTDVFV